MSAPAAHRFRTDTGTRWIVLALILLASFVSYLLRINMSIVSEAVISDLGLTPVQLGMVFRDRNFHRVRKECSRGERGWSRTLEESW